VTCHVYFCRDINLPFPYWILKLFRLWRIFWFVFLFYWYIFWGTFKLISNYKLKYLSTSLSYDGQFQFHFVNRSRSLYPWNVGEIFMWQNGKMYFLFVFSWLWVERLHANIFHLWVKCQLSWIVQITWIYDIHLCIAIQSNSQNIIQCSISNSLWYKEGNLCLTFLANDNENAWHLIEFILPQYISTHVILQTNMACRIPCWMKSQYCDKQNPTTGHSFELYCSINNWIRHTFHNLETFSLIYTFKTVASSFQF
jgi:hypothetical protein